MKQLTRVCGRIIGALVVLACMNGVFVSVATSADAAPASCTTQTLRVGSKGPCVLELQQRLTAAGFAVSPQSGFYGNITRGAVINYQRSRGITPVSGMVASKTWASLLREGASPVARPLDPRCYAPGVVICAKISDKTTYIMRSGSVDKALLSRFGGVAWDRNTSRWVTKATPTGTYRVGYKNVNAFSNSYQAAMPYFTGFIGAVYGFHYSPTFASVGYGPNGNLGSHGCVNLKTLEDAKYLYDAAPRGTLVIIMP